MPIVFSNPFRLIEEGEVFFSFTFLLDSGDREAYANRFDCPASSREFWITFP